MFQAQSAARGYAAPGGLSFQTTAACSYSIERNLLHLAGNLAGMLRKNSENTRTELANPELREGWLRRDVVCAASKDNTLTADDD